MDSKNLFWESYLDIENDVLAISRIVLFSDGPHGNNVTEDDFTSFNQMEVCSNYIGDLLVRCATQVESAMKMLYRKLRISYGLPDDFEKTKYPPEPKQLNFDVRCFDVVNHALDIEHKVVNVNESRFDLKKEEYVNLTPLSRGQLHDDKNGWGYAYQTFKHNRYISLRYANLKNLLNACAALYLLNIYIKYFDDPILMVSRNTFQNASYSLGSKLFYLVKPDLSGTLETDNIPIFNPKSPFIAIYSDEEFKKLDNEFKKARQKQLSHFLNMKELFDPEFQNILMESRQKSPNNDFRLDLELTKYKLHKVTKSQNSFDDKINAISKTEEWKSVEKLNNPRLKLNLITEENFESMLDQISLLYCGIIAGSTVSTFVQYGFNAPLEIRIALNIKNWVKNS